MVIIPVTIVFPKLSIQEIHVATNVRSLHIVLNGRRIFQMERADNRILHLRVIGSASMRLALE